MKLLLSFLITLLTFSAAAQELNVMTFNIRLDLASDSLNAWKYRKDKAVSQILYHKADIVGVQEAVPGQMDDFNAALKDYKSVGVGRDDGNRKGEFSAIFYNTKRLNVSKSGTFWLSQTPEVAGSKGWDAAYPRIVTWAIFTDKKTKKTFFHFNTHFDHMGQEARRQSAKMLLQKIKEIAGNNPVLVTGDFNAAPEDEPIRIITNENDPLHLTDTEKLSATPHYGPYGSFTGWAVRDNNTHIDYIFTKQHVKVLSHATLSEIWGTRYSSDHFPVIASVVIE